LVLALPKQALCDTLESVENLRKPLDMQN